jgi:hypothetical protein
MTPNEKEAAMLKFEYEITKHADADFKQFVYLCNAKGECSLDEIEEKDLESVEQLLNEMGRNGWELIQFSSGSDGLIAFWKRRIE